MNMLMRKMASVGALLAVVLVCGGWVEGKVDLSEKYPPMALEVPPGEFRVSLDHAFSVFSINRLERDGNAYLYVARFDLLVGKPKPTYRITLHDVGEGLVVAQLAARNGSVCPMRYGIYSKGSWIRGKPDGFFLADYKLRDNDMPDRDVLYRKVFSTGDGGICFKVKETPEEVVGLLRMLVKGEYPAVSYSYLK